MFALLRVSYFESLRFWFDLNWFGKFKIVIHVGYGFSFNHITENLLRQLNWRDKPYRIHSKISSFTGLLSFLTSGAVLQEEIINRNFFAHDTCIILPQPSSLFHSVSAYLLRTLDNSIFFRFPWSRLELSEVDCIWYFSLALLSTLCVFQASTVSGP